jgi:transposase
MMRFYNQPHRFYAGIDLHARTLYLCVLDQTGNILVHQNLAAKPDQLLAALAPYRDDLVVACECMFAWYWVADLCATHNIDFVLGHALFMKAIHGGKTKNDKIDALKIATLLRGGALPQAYVYPKGMRETRDLLRRRSFFVRQRAHLIAHVQNAASQYLLEPFAKKLTFAANREELDVASRFDDPSVRRAIAADLALVDAYDEQIGALELHLTRTAKIDDPQAYHRLRSIPGVGPVLGLVLLYEIHDIRRFASPGKFLSYARLVAGSHESAGKKKGSPGRKMGNAHLKWAFSEAACLIVRHSDKAKRWLERNTKKRGKARALAILSAKLGRTVWHLLTKREVFEEVRVFGQ